MDDRSPRIPVAHAPAQEGRPIAPTAVVSRAHAFRNLRGDVLAGLTVALVAVPQCMGFAMIAGLPAVSGIYSAVVMGLISAAVSKSPKLVIGPAITASTMLLAVLRTVDPAHPENWPPIAAAMAVLVGGMTVLAAALRVGQLVRFVSRSVIVGLIAGSAILTIGAQLAPMLGISPGRQPTLIGILWSTLARAGETHLAAVMMAAGTSAFVMLGGRLGPRFPAAFLALALGGVAAWWLERSGAAIELQAIGALAWTSPARLIPALPGPPNSDLLVGAAAITLVGIIQNLAIGKALAIRADERFDARRELWGLGLANVAAGLTQGFPGSGSFARSALNDLAGARTRLSGFVAAAATALIALLAAPLARYITLPAIGGLLLATAVSMIDWKELRTLLRDRHDRLVLGTTTIGVVFLPIHWAVLIGLAVSVALFLRRVSRLHMFEMVRGADGPFREQELDAQTGRSLITMLQVEGPLFFAHADEIGDMLRVIFARKPQVTILRMRRTQQIDFSVIAALNRVMAEYVAAGGHVIICGLAPPMRARLADSPLRETLGSDFLLETTREVFGSAHIAIGLARSITEVDPNDPRPLFRSGAAS